MGRSAVAREIAGLVLVLAGIGLVGTVFAALVLAGSVGLAVMLAGGAFALVCGWGAMAYDPVKVATMREMRARRRAGAVSPDAP